MANPRPYASEILALKRLAATAALALAILTSILFAPITWAATRETVLHSFGKGADGISPLRGSLVFDSAGNLYGTTNLGGTYSLGTVFELTPKANGGWTEKVIYSFDNGAGGNSRLRKQTARYPGLSRVRSVG